MTQSGNLERNEGTVTNGAQNFLHLKVPKQEEFGKERHEKDFLYNL